jgi:hypothetical protein
MLFSRSKELEEDYQHTQTLLDSQNVERISNTIRELIQFQSSESGVIVPEHLLTDMQMDDYLSQFAITTGGKEHIRKLFRYPTIDTQILAQRANIMNHRIPIVAYELVEKLRKDENDVLWLCSLPPMKDAWPLSFLFPSWPIIRYINLFPIGLMIYHIYRAYISPWLSIAYPASTIIGPWIYIRRQMNWPLPFKSYVNILRMGLSAMLKSSGNYYQDMSKYLTLIVYLMLFVYGIVQSFDVAKMLRTILKDVGQKMEGVERFMKNAVKLHEIMHKMPWQSIDDFKEGFIKINRNMSSFYSLWKSAEKMEIVRNTLRRVYAQDTWLAIQRMKSQKGWCIPQFIDRGETQLWGMGHPTLIYGGRRNPVLLAKNLIITGPNAAGKTTYMKSVCLNLLLGQSFGIMCCHKAVVTPFQLFGSFLRIQDQLGTASLFEAEVNRCANMIQMADLAHKYGQRALFLLDEPMHSTPPIEGAATAMATVEKLASYPNVRVLCTTHYHQLTSLEKDAERPWFMNVSMECMEKMEGGFVFPYILTRGPSYQCIALELMRTKEIPDDVVKRALEIKSKICATVIE